MTSNNQPLEDQTPDQHAVITRIHLGLKEGSALVFLLAGVFLFLCLISYHPEDPGWSHIGETQLVNNWLGKSALSCLMPVSVYLALWLISFRCFFYRILIKRCLNVIVVIKSILKWLASEQVAHVCQCCLLVR